MLELIDMQKENRIVIVWLFHSQESKAHEFRYLCT